ncbi:Gag-Pol poly [Paramuricea clavata]|uniref:Gag-Pol poly n=1 Tax=Paramuricea clavata TaxID=317549 RepID=A0A7D9JDG7_PARCT|nr:Gag-Pol poly [Paramuricea clavata]
MAFNPTRNQRQKVDCEDSDDLDEEDEENSPEEQLPPSSNVLPAVQQLVNRRNALMENPANVPEPLPSPSLYPLKLTNQDPAPRQNIQTPRSENFARGERVPCDLDGFKLPLAWELPRVPLPAHLEIDINNLEKAKAIPKFSGDIRDYMNWRTAFLETVHFKVRETASRKIVALYNALPEDVVLKISRGLTHAATGYVSRIKNLEEEYGDEELLYNVVWNNLNSAPYIGNLKQTTNIETFIRLFDEFANHAILLGIPHDDRLVFSIIISKFDEDIVLGFKENANLTGKASNATNFRDWLNKARRDILSVRTSKMKSWARGESGSAKRYERSSNAVKGKPSFGKLFVSDNSSEECPVCSKAGHLAETCKIFLKGLIKDRLKIVRDKKLCFICLKVGHMASECPNPKKCYCGKNHHARLHREKDGKVQNVKTFLQTDVEEFETEGEDSESEVEVEETPQD